MKLFSIQRILYRKLTLKEAENLLGVSKSSSSSEIKSAYIEKAKKFHPDNQETGDAKKFRDLKEAAEILENPAKAEIVREESSWNMKNARQPNPHSKYERRYQRDRQAQQQPYRRPKEVGYWVFAPLIGTFIVFKLYKYLRDAAEEVRLAPYEITPEQPFDEQLVILLVRIKKRRRYRFSIKQLILEYNNHIQRGLRVRVQ